MIGIRQLTQERLELFASHFPLETLKPYLLEAYRDAFATIVLYEDNFEAYHETGILRFDASDPDTFNYEEFQAPLIAEYHDRLAVCTVENLFLHFERLMASKPLEDDPFHNLVFSISFTPPSPDVLKEWEHNMDERLKRLIYDAKSTEHFHLFEGEACVVYSHGNHFTSVTSEREDLIQAVFEDVVERHLAPISPAPYPASLIQTLYHHAKIYGCIRLKPDRLFKDKHGEPFLLVSYPRRSSARRKRVARLHLSDKGEPQALSDAELMPRLQYHLRYTDFSLLPLLLVISLMGFVVLATMALKVFVSPTPLSS